MKKLILLLLFSSFAFAQNVAKKETVNKFLLKGWTADYAMMNDQKIENMEQIKKMEYVFNADKTYVFNDDKSGQWKYNEKKRAIELFQDGKLKSTITTLKSNSFVMILNPDKSAPKGVKDFQIFFKLKV